MLVNTLKAKAYFWLDACGFNHAKAKREGYKDGWDMLLDRHDDNAAVLFHVNVASSLSQKQVVVLYDDIVKEYVGYPDFMAYARVVSKMSTNGVPPYQPEQEIKNDKDE